jgi:hypothetical protein
VVIFVLFIRGMFGFRNRNERRLTKGFLLHNKQGSPELPLWVASSTGGRSRTGHTHPSIIATTSTTLDYWARNGELASNQPGLLRQP